MTSIPPTILSWIGQNYPKPKVDPAWLGACLSWIAEELNLTDVQSQSEEIIKNVEMQLLNSDLRDSMLEGTGFPADIASLENTKLRGRFLVQIMSITEIGHSAFTLQNTHQMRIDRADLTGLAEENDNDDPDDGPIPKFPRSMLKFEISDGTHSIRAIEFKKLPELELGVTPLGYKMIIKDVLVRRGIAFLEPLNVELKGYMTEELEVYRDAQFAEDIRQRLGRPDPEDGAQRTPALNDAVSAGSTLVGSNTNREPLRDLGRDEAPGHSRSHLASQEHEHEPITRRRRIPAQHSAPTTSTSQLSTTNAPIAPLPRSRTFSASVRQPSKLSQEIRVEHDSSEFGDDETFNEEFMREVDNAEQAAMGGGETNAATSNDSSHHTDENVEVITIDSDSEDKENVAPDMPRRVRRRIASPEENVIVID